jgi:nucleoside 2-deoxyribosyltransferase
MKIYVASFFDTRERLLPIVEQIKAIGHSVTSSWLKEPKASTYANVTDGYRLACAIQDMTDIREASLVIIDTNDLSPRGGREFEMGYAIARGIPCMIVGPNRTVFHRLALHRFETWEEAIKGLKELDNGR